MQGTPQIRMALGALLQGAEAVWLEVVLELVAGVADDYLASRDGRRLCRCVQRRRLAQLLDAHEQALLVELILYAHVLQSELFIIAVVTRERYIGEERAVCQ